MELIDWLHAKRKEDPTYTGKRFAEIIGAHPSRLGRIMRYKVCPSSKIALKIEEVTEGAVSGWEIIKKNLIRNNGE